MSDVIRTAVVKTQTRVSIALLLASALCGCGYDFRDLDHVIGPKVPGWPSIRYVSPTMCATMREAGNALDAIPQVWHAQTCESLGIPNRQVPK